MTKLSDTQVIILSAAAQREDCIALPLPDSLRGGAATKVVNAMIAKGFIEEVDMRQGEHAWRETGDGHCVMLVATEAGISAIGFETDSAENKPTEDAAPKTCTPRTGTKQAALIDMLCAPDGASIDEIGGAMQWAPNTIRGAMAGALKRGLG